MAKDCNGTQIGDGIIGIAVAATVIAYFYFTNDTSRINTSMAEQGLEQCPRTLLEIDNTNIWVKDCNSHLSSLSKIKD